MNEDLRQLITLLVPEKCADARYEATNVPYNRHHIFGGQIIAQSISAAMQESASDMFIHSCHAYFLRMGKRDQNVQFDVQLIRQGRSFATRRVTALQDNKPIFETLLSFQKKQDGLAFQDSMPNVKMPEDLEDELLRWNAHPKVQETPERLATFMPLDIRHCDPMDWFDADPASPKTGLWIKTKDKLPDDPDLHKIILSYLSDLMLCAAALRPHGLTFQSPNLHGASLDHGLWFHDDFRVDDWLFYQQEGIWSGGSRGLNQGKIYTRAGKHIASTMQEGLMRYTGDLPDHPDKP